ncbi:DUF421 domain-containing protein [Siphonobacter aquaeclarae]|uniref:Uncharacterized membrane protein YcaP, DUF421 family n=1 Tax=Siphonobacter aquaeclarae TaxID=563176 RepID=A0A1G9RDC8_9BACT|nr:YetF domain-containing protein [Siphonobacter aquaeclarae]SDM21223.1 Uncharacterized membrane protein YcaP, DUF421 family [Siphonobacter aquaeclarae]
MQDLLTITGRSVAVYLFIVLAIRLFGKKELAQLSVVDLVFILLISNSVQNAMVGPDTSLAGGLMAAVALFLTNYVLKYVLLRNEKINRLLQGEPVMLVYKGRVKQKGLSIAQISEEELLAAVREHGVEHISDVDLAVLEVDGNISVMSNDFHKKTTKKRKVHRVLKSDS